MLDSANIVSTWAQNYKPNSFTPSFPSCAVSAARENHPSFNTAQEFKVRHFSNVSYKLYIVWFPNSLGYIQCLTIRTRKKKTPHFKAKTICHVVV
jgi:hypothetical protein